MIYKVGGEIYHHGIDGQRWGVKNGPPYPLGTGDHSPAERKQAKRGIKSLAGYFKARKVKKKRLKALQAARKGKVEAAKRRQEEANHEANKEKALRSGSAADIMKYQGELTNQQLQDALTRLQKEGELSKLAKAGEKTTSDKIDSIVNKIDKGRRWAESGINAYNTAAKVINAFSEYDDLPIVGEKHKTRSEKETEKLNKALKKLSVENNQLKNERQSLENKEQKLKNKGLKIRNKNAKNGIFEPQNESLSGLSIKTNEDGTITVSVPKDKNNNGGDGEKNNKKKKKKKK